MRFCRKQCPVNKLRNGFRLSYCASCVFTVLGVLAFIFIVIFNKDIFPNSAFSRIISYLWPKACVISGGLKDVSMTVGLTGVLFAWLLQIIGDRCCGLQMDELFCFEFRRYTFQIFLFITATVACIISCNLEKAWTLLAPVSFLNMFSGIVGMWLMCAAFLFSTGNRRIIAFCAMETTLTKDWKPEYLELWVQELNQCAVRGEEQHIETCFQLLRAKAKEACDKEGPQACAEFCGDTIGQMWIQVGAGRWSQYLHYLLKPPCNNPESYLLLSAYLLQPANLGETERDGERDDKRYQTVMECLGRGARDMERVPGDLLVLYLAFVAVHQLNSLKPIDPDIFSRMQEIRWNWELHVAHSKMGKYQKFVLDWMIWSYGIAFTYSYKSFAVRMKNTSLREDFTRLMKLYPWKWIGEEGEGYQ